MENRFQDLAPFRNRDLFSNRKRQYVWVWANLSRGIAEHATGKVVLITEGTGPKPESFFTKYEEPVLRKNGVTVSLFLWRKSVC